MKMKIILSIIILAAIACQKPQLEHPTFNSASSEKGAYDSLVKTTDSFYVQNCVAYHKLKWNWWYMGAIAYVSDTTVILAGSPCILLPIPPGFFKTVDSTYEKYCLDYHEVTWHNQTYWPWGDKDTIYVHGNTPCYPTHEQPPNY